MAVVAGLGARELGLGLGQRACRRRGRSRSRLARSLASPARPRRCASAAASRGRRRRRAGDRRGARTATTCRRRCGRPGRPSRPAGCVRLVRSRTSLTPRRSETWLRTSMRGFSLVGDRTGARARRATLLAAPQATRASPLDQHDAIVAAARLEPGAFEARERAARSGARSWPTSRTSTASSLMCVGALRRRCGGSGPCRRRRRRARAPARRGIRRGSAAMLASLTYGGLHRMRS